MSNVRHTPRSGQARAIAVDASTFQFQSGNARMTVTITRDGHLVTTHEYDRALVKRVSIQADHAEVMGFAKWLIEAIAIKPFGGSDR